MVIPQLGKEISEMTTIGSLFTAGLGEHAARAEAWPQGADWALEGSLVTFHSYIPASTMVALIDLRTHPADLGGNTLVLLAEEVESITFSGSAALTVFPISTLALRDLGGSKEVVIQSLLDEREVSARAQRFALIVGTVETLDQIEPNLADERPIQFGTDFPGVDSRLTTSRVFVTPSPS